MRYQPIYEFVPFLNTHWHADFHSMSSYSFWLISWPITNGFCIKLACFEGSWLWDYMHKRTRALRIKKMKNSSDKWKYLISQKFAFEFYIYKSFFVALLLILHNFFIYLSLSSGGNLVQTWPLIALTSGLL